MTHVCGCDSCVAVLRCDGAAPLRWLWHILAGHLRSFSRNVGVCRAFFHHGDPRGWGWIFIPYDSLLLSKATTKEKENRRVWVHHMNRNRKQKGTFSALMPELYDDEEKFMSYFRLSREQFALTLHLIHDDLLKTYMIREPISPKERLAICIS